jgi:hypothetical protein
MNQEKAESIICNAVKEIHKILFSTTFSALISTPHPKKSKRRRVVASVDFADMVIRRWFFNYAIILVTDHKNQMTVKTMTKSIHYVPAEKAPLWEIYANADLSMFLKPYQKVTTIETFSVESIVSDFFTTVDEYLKYTCHNISHPKLPVSYFEILMKEHTTSLTSCCKN